MLQILRDTLRSLRAHALRFTLTSLGILWGAFMLTYLSATMKGLDDHFTERLETTGPKILIAFPGTVIKNRVGERGAREVELDIDDVERLRALSLLDGAVPGLRMWNKLIRAGGHTKLLTVGGVAPASQRIRNFEVAQGRFITPTDIDHAARVVFLGSESATRLFGREPPIGQRLQIESHAFRVVGVAEKKGDQLVGINGKDDLAVLVPYTTAQRLLMHSDVLREIVLEPETREASFEAMWHVRQLLGLHHHFEPELDTALSFFNVQEIMQILQTVFLGLRVFMLTAGIVTLLVGAVGVMNIMLVVVGERTNEIGLRKAIGASRMAIFAQFVAEATAVSTLAGLVGAAGGIGFTRLVAAHTPPNSPMQAVPILDPLTVGVIITSLVVVGIVAGVAPAIRATRVDPAEALRAV
jgi:putative ABC transport system permease protein